MNGIIRVFPRRHKQYTPNDDYVFIGYPPNFPELIPEHREVHISCVFTWDKSYCEELAYQWEGKTNKPVKLGGPAFGSPAEDFIPGMYTKKNIIYTTRGCNNNCSYCRVPSLEGKLRELPIHPGNWIQDNNFLQASRAHKEKVFNMLRTQSGICFKGGPDVDLIDEHFCEFLRSTYYIRGVKKVSKVSELWLACDTDEALPRFKKAVKKLIKVGFNREKIKCYALVGSNREKDEARLREIYYAGAMPFAMLYRNFSETKTLYDRDTEKWAEQWIRPAEIKAHMEKGTCYTQFAT